MNERANRKTIDYNAASDFIAKNTPTKLKPKSKKMNVRIDQSSFYYKQTKNKLQDIGRLFVPTNEDLFLEIGSIRRK